MSAAIVAVFAGSILVNLFVGGFIFWLACRVCRIPRVTYRRALAVVLIASVLAMLIQFMQWYSGGESQGAVLLWSIVCLGLVFAALKVGFRAGVGKTILVGIMGFGLTFAFCFAGAMLVRATMAEAFSVSAGSMALAIYGDHVTHTCSTCGFQYVRGIDLLERERAPRVQLHCPNCDSRADTLDRPRIASPADGDRILADKLSPPRRWELIVFEDPADGTTNFVKRLVGLPGEVVEIIDGDVYAARLEDLKKVAGFPFDQVLGELEKLQRDVYAFGHDHTGDRDDLLRRYAELNKQIAPYLQIQRKLQQTPEIQESLWQNVYNHDCLPAHADSQKRVGWEPEDENAAKAWNISGREITFTSAAPVPLFVRFAGKPIRDFSAYNSEYFETSLRPVGDVRLRFTWFPDGGEGGIVMEMNRDEATFAAEIRRDGTVALSGRIPDEQGEMRRVDIGSRKLEAFSKGQAVKVEFINVDYEVRLVVNGQKLLDTCEADEDLYRPDVSHILSKRRNGGYEVKDTEVRIGARNLSGQLRHVVLERDIYYIDITHLSEMKGSGQMNPYAGWPGWGTAGMPILLRPERQGDGRMLPGEYFVLGDNSPASRDSRLWWEIGPRAAAMGAEYQAGTVPGDHLVGVVLWTYWPPERWRAFP